MSDIKRTEEKTIEKGKLQGFKYHVPVYRTSENDTENQESLNASRS